MTKSRPYPVKLHETAGELLVPADQIKPHPMNPNNGDTEEIMLSMRRNGVYRPVYVQKSTGWILAGHHVYAALLELGAESVPVAWVDCDAKTADRIVAADNRIAQLARMDDAVLVQLLQGLDGDLAGTGYSDDDMAKLLGALDDELQYGDADTDEAPAAWGVVVECRDETQQTELLERFSAEGLDCRALM